MRHPTFSIRVDALNRSRQPEDDGDPGLGPSTCPEDATELPPLTQSEAQPDHTAQERQIKLSVPPRDVPTFEQIIADNPSAEAKRWHPEGKSDAAHDSAPPFRSPSEHPPDGLERIPSEANL